MQAGNGETVTGTEGHGAAPRRRRSLDLDEDAQVASMAELPRSAAVPRCGCRGHPCCCRALVGTSQLGRLSAHPVPTPVPLPTRMTTNNLASISDDVRYNKSGCPLLLPSCSASCCSKVAATSRRLTPCLPH